MKLFTPLEIKNTVFKNRLVMAPMCQYSCMNHDGVLSTHHKMHYGARALGQVGFIIVEATGISPEGRITDTCLGLWNQTQADQMKTLVDDIHTLGSVIGIQLNHAGRKCTAVDGVDVIYGASAIPFDETSRTPKELSIEEIQDVFKDFQDAALRADEAGFDALEIHGAHGYLVSTFLSPITNQRNDKYANPTVFLEELLDHIEAVWPKEKLLTIRVSASDYEVGGTGIDEMIQILAPLQKRFDMIHVSSGGITNIMPPRIYPGYQTPFATAIKEAFDIPVITCGLINQLDLVSDILENDRADMVAMGRNLLKDPQWLLKQAQIRRKEGIVPKQYLRAYR